jgi:predicted RNA binding protein YcfA (HicA-like mRNA interferase family)
MKKVFKVREIITILISLGWYLDRQNGTSHRQFKHPTIRSTVTVDGKLSGDVNPNNLKSMEKQAGIKFRDFAN